MEFQEMQVGAITFVLAETILGKMSAEVTHHRITCDFRDDARGGDAKTKAIAIDNGSLRKRKWNNWQAVDQYVFGCDRERGDCRTHRFVRGTQNIDSIDLLGIDNADCPAESGIRD
jgi:hypothetical protein